MWSPDDILFCAAVLTLVCPFLLLCLAIGNAVRYLIYCWDTRNAKTPCCDLTHFHNRGICQAPRLINDPTHDDYIAVTIQPIPYLNPSQQPSGPVSIMCGCNQPNYSSNAVWQYEFEWLDPTNCYPFLCRYVFMDVGCFLITIALLLISMYTPVAHWLNTLIVVGCTLFLLIYAGCFVYRFYSGCQAE